MANIYPPGPVNVPSNFTSLTPGYRLRVGLVLASLLITLALYLGLLLGSFFLCRWLVIAPWPARMDRGYGFVRIAAIICSALLFLYLLKGLFKRSRQDESLLEEITEEEQPDLFAFIRRICADTGAPFPKHIYVTPEVNAAVFYHSSFLNLFFPTRKNLLIGLGLVNNLNISEFKAVLAHEFGHFSQKSMKLGTYVYVANKVLADIIYGRDFLDDIVNQAKGWDLRIAIFVWVFLGVLWGLRKGLEAVFKVINIFNLSLMREMEFNADRMAVSVAGSDAMVHALLRSGFADKSFQQLSGDLWAAADHHLYSRDIFYHQQPAGDLLRRRARNLRLGLPPESGGPKVQVFAPGEDDLGIPLMWQTHPSNHDREQSAKAAYVPAEVDERPAWLLFQNAEDLRFRVSQRYYQALHKLEETPSYVEPAVVQRFLDDEYAETTFSERYHGFYDNRYLEIKDLDACRRQAHAESLAKAEPHELVAEIDSIFGPALQQWVEDHQKRLGDFDLLDGLKQGQLALKEKTLKLRGQLYGPNDVSMLLGMVEKELEEDRRTMADLDERAFRLHVRLAGLGGPDAENSLVARYRFHLAIQPLHKQIIQAQGEAQGALMYASSRRQLSPEEFAGVRDLLQKASRKLSDTLRAAEPLRIPALRNIPADTSLRDFLLQQAIVEHLTIMTQNIEPFWISRFMGQLLEVQDKLKRILFKSLGGILAAQEQISQAARDSGPAMVTAP
jgi:Zn-dependent protease with chaperone function